MKSSQSLSQENSHILNAVMLVSAISQSIKYLYRYFVTWFLKIFLKTESEVPFGFKKLKNIIIFNKKFYWGTNL